MLEKKEEYLNQDRFTLSQYRTDGLLKFYYQKPIPEDRKFSYIKLLALIKKLEENNRIAKLVFTVTEPKARLDNKKQYMNNAEKLRIEIVNFLNEIESFYKERKLVLTEYS